MIKQQWIGFKTIFKKEAHRNIRLWRQTVVPPAISSILYFVIFGHVIGKNIGQMNGYPYAEFIASGLIMMQIIVQSYSNTAFSMFMCKFDRSIEELLVSPLSPFIILTGLIAGGVFRGLIVGLVVTIIAIFFANLTVHSILLVFLVALLSAILFSCAGIINALGAKTFDDINIVPTFVLTPLTYLGGVFYSIKLLPPFWQTISLFNPIVYIINAFRYGFLGVADSSILVGFCILLLFLIGLFALAYYLLLIRWGLTD